MPTPPIVIRELRGTPQDICGYTAERRMERELIGWYEALVVELLPQLEATTIDRVVTIAAQPMQIRGYGPVKEKAVRDAKARYAQLAADLVNPPPAPRQIAAE